MKIITIDFETYYDKDFSLSKLTTEEYVRDEKFEVIGVGVKDGHEPAVWCSGTDEEIKAFLDSFELDKHLVLAHNAIFDAAILTWHYGISPRGWLDTLSMARAIHTTEVGGSLAALAKHYEVGEKGNEVILAIGKHRADFTPEALEAYGGYCCNDCDLTYYIFQLMSHQFPQKELRLIDLTIRMFSEPVLRLDVEGLRRHLLVVQARKLDLLRSVSLERDHLMSSDRLAMTLERMGVVPPRKISPTTGKETWAFAKSDEEFKALLEHENPQVQALVAARLGVKSTLEETRTERFISIGQRGALPVPLRYYAAHTGRWGGDDKLNLQNLPRSSPLKKCIMAPAGYVLVDSDSSQIEARTLAWLAGQDDLVSAFERGEDVYRIMASAIYGKPEAQITKDERFVGKTTILGAGYGMGAAKFQAQLKTFGVETSLDECKRVIEVYRRTYPYIPELWREASKALEAIERNAHTTLGRDGVLKVEGQRGISLPNGLYIKYPNLRTQRADGKAEMVYDTKKGKSVIPNRIYGGKVVENVCQALARIIIGEQMLMAAKKYKVAMTVHDAICCVVPEHEAESGKEFVELCMRIRPQWCSELPLNCEAGVAKTYGDC
jgi:DNA polymerase I-like protein with 3'-5' exonuclease and polymerase domains